MDIRKFNAIYADPRNKELIRKSLSSSSGSGGALIPEKLDNVVTNKAVQLVPELGIPVLRFDHQKIHEFNQLTTIPAAGSNMGENAVTPTTSSGYDRNSVTLKIMRRKGQVTGFQQDAALNYADSVILETENQIQSFGNDIRVNLLYGNAGADQYSFNGLDSYIQTNRIILTGGDQVPSNFELMDNAIDANHELGGNGHYKVFLMSPRLLSKFSGLATTIRDNRSAKRSAEDYIFDGGQRLESYRGIPILETTGTRPAVDRTTGLDPMGTVTLSAAGAGGGIADDEYWIRIAPVTWQGEQIASASNNSITTTSNDSITASFTAVPNALFYRVYLGLAVDTETLIKVVSAFTYDGNGTPTGAISSITLTSVAVDTASVSTFMTSDVPYDRDGTSNEPAETMFLWDIDENQGLGRVAYTNSGADKIRGLITMKPLAETDDNIPFLLKTYAALVPCWEATSTMIRGIRVK